MQFFYHKMGKANRFATDWLNGNNPLNKPATAIRFAKTTLEQIRNNDCDPQAFDFYVSSLPENRDNTIIIVVHEGQIYFLKPAGNITEIEIESENWKVMPVEIVSVELLKNVPAVLAGINANTYLSLGTYREIKHNGNIKAIYVSLGLSLPQEHLPDKNCGSAQLFECLSSVELETLIAKLFESVGCFVPAHRGGQVKDIDLFAYNDSSTQIDLDGVKIPGNGSISIQVKGGTKKLKKPPTGVDYLIGYGISDCTRCFGSDWLLTQIKKYPELRYWLKRSLNWLPNEFLLKYNL